MPLPLTVSWLVLPFWYWLTWVFPDIGPLNGCVCVCVCVTQVPGDWWNIGCGACWCRCVCIDDILLRLFPGVAGPRSSHHRVQFASVAVRSQTAQLQRRLRSTRTTQRSASCFTSHSQRTNVFFLSFVAWVSEWVSTVFFKSRLKTFLFSQAFSSFSAH